MEVGIGGGNWRWERGLGYIREVGMGPWDNEGGNRGRNRGVGRVTALSL